MKTGYLLLLTMLLACKSQSQINSSQLIGRWDSTVPRSENYLCFSEDRTMRLGNDTICVCEQTYNWQINEDTLILTRGQDVLKSEVEITGKTVLTLTTLFGNRADLVSTYVRRKKKR